MYRMLVLIACGAVMLACPHDFARTRDAAVDRTPGDTVADRAVDHRRHLRLRDGQVDTIGGPQVETVPVVLATPRDVVLSAAGAIYTVNDARLTTIVGTTVTHVGTKDGSQDGPLDQATFYSPEGLALDDKGQVFVADTYNNRIRLVSDNAVSTLAGSGVRGYLDGPAASARFDYPVGVVVDPTGVVYVADTGSSCIRRIAHGTVDTLAGACGVHEFNDGAARTALFYYPRGLALDRAGSLYIADQSNHRIRVLHKGRVTTFAGGVRGYLDSSTDHARFDHPGDVAVDDAGAVYVADTYNCTIRVIAGGAVTTLAGVAGICGYRDGPALQAWFNYPYGVAVDAAGTVYVADTSNNHIRIIRR